MLVYKITITSPKQELNLGDLGDGSLVEWAQLLFRVGMARQRLIPHRRHLQKQPWLAYCTSCILLNSIEESITSMQCLGDAYEFQNERCNSLKKKYGL